MLVTALLILLSTLSNGFWIEEMENPALFEGDIILDHEERLASQNNAYASVKDKRWPGAIVPYEIKGKLGKSVMKTLPLAFAEYEKKTCLRFKKRTNEASYVQIFHGQGCAGGVGYRNGKKTVLSLDSFCYRLGTVMHEIGHAIGFWHEQNRPDRDKYVEILYKNIPENVRFNFDKGKTSEIDSLGTPYDYLSIMHYNRKAFGGGSLTIVTKDPTFQKQIGQREGLSDIDIIQINKMYCSDGTRPTLPPVPVTIPQTTAPAGCRDTPGNPCEHWKKVGWCKSYESIKKLCCKSCSG